VTGLFFSASLRNLRTEFVDSLVLHSPLSFEDTLIVWREFEALFRAGRARRLGISNCYDAAFLVRLFDAAEVKPSVLQNRFYNRTGYDGAVRRFCREQRIAYQSFWTLTANKHVLSDPAASTMASRYGLTPACVFYRALVQMGITPLSGTSSEEHMRQDVEVADGVVQLEPSDVEQLVAKLEIME
jgi:diketogulonate reductase-like aldo/keto reductase